MAPVRVLLLIFLGRAKVMNTRRMPKRTAALPSTMPTPCHEQKKKKLGRAVSIAEIC